MSDRHIVVGAGPVGTQVARLLAARGSEVAMVTRRGTTIDVPASSAPVESVTLDASDADGLSALADGAVAIYNCANPADYTKWAAQWPALASALGTAARRTGAVLAVTGNLYPYGPLDGQGQPMVEGLPDVATDSKGAMRASMWADLKKAHDAGELRAVEVRASDYVGPGVGENGIATRVIPAALQGRAAWVLDAADQPHSFTDVRDEARALVTVVDRPHLWGRVWHAPTNPALTMRQTITDILASVGRKAVAVRVIPRALTVPMGWVMPLFGELNDLSYQRTAPYVLDSTHSERELDLAPTPWREVCRATALGNADGVVLETALR